MHIVYSEYQNITPQLLSEFKQNSARAFRVIYDTYDSRLLQYASRICMSRQEAEEVVQDVFLRLWGHRDKIEGSDITGWLITTCRNLAINSLRNYISKVDISQISEPSSTQANGLQQLYAEDIEQLIEEVIGSLPPMRKKIFLMSREAAMSHKEIAVKLGISVTTVSNQMSKALDHIRLRVTPMTYAMVILYLLQH